jgi:hypothetical protein
MVLYNRYLLGLGVVLCALPLIGLIFLKKTSIKLVHLKNEILLDYNKIQKVELEVQSPTNVTTIKLKHNKKWNKEQKYEINSSASSGNLSFNKIKILCELHPYAPGLNTNFVFKIKEKDPFHLLNTTTFISPDLLVYCKVPKIEVSSQDLEKFEKSVSLYSEEPQDFTLKEWVPGESYDHINWKLSAKTGKKILKIPEKNKNSLVIKISPDFNGVEEFNLLREKVVKSLEKFNEIKVVLGGESHVVSRENMESFELFLSKNLVNKDWRG